VSEEKRKIFQHPYYVKGRMEDLEQQITEALKIVF
jgi:hypothetical protein